MAKVNNRTIELNEEEATLLMKHKELMLIPNQKGIFLLIDKELTQEKEGKQVCVTVPQKENLEKEKQEVIGLIRKENLSKLVEGKFEQTLNEKQRKALLELVATSQVFVFKLNETYKKGVYKIKEENSKEENREKKESEDFNAKEKNPEEYSIKKDGFLITKSKERAAKISFEYEKEIKEGLLRGMKSFDGNYYLIQTDLLEAYIRKTVLCFNNKPTQTLEEQAKNINASKQLTQIINEFLKEEGEIIERKKGQYTYIK
jgi:hypothetical protein